MPRHLVVVLIIAIVVATSSIWWWQQNNEPKPEGVEIVKPEATGEEIRPPEELVIPTFTRIEIPLAHDYDDTALAFLVSAAVNIDSDGREEIFIGGGKNQDDAVFRYANGSFIRLPDPGLSQPAATYGVLVVDRDEDGDNDLIIARDDGVYLHENTGDSFTSEKLDIPLPDRAVPLHIAAGDVNLDGQLDLFVSTFRHATSFRSAVFNDPSHRTNNLLLLGSADGSFTDATEISGVVTDQNTFQSAFVDLDGDALLDLVITGNTGQGRIFHNIGDAQFAEVALDTGYGYFMGLGLGDMDSDGDVDIFLSNVGTTISRGLLDGDLRADQRLNPDWVVLQNDGDMQFADIQPEIALKNAFSWGGVFADWNLDGREDLAISENYVKWPPHRLRKLTGSFYVQDLDGSYQLVTDEANAENRNYGISPVVTDLNADGYPDLVQVNLSGESLALLNDGGIHGYLAAQMPHITRAIRATLQLQTTDGREMTKVFAKSQGLLADQSGTLTFGLGAYDEPETLTATYPGGETAVWQDFARNQTVVVE